MLVFFGFVVYQEKFLMEFVRPHSLVDVHLLLLPVLVRSVVPVRGLCHHHCCSSDGGRYGDTHDDGDVSDSYDGHEAGDVDDVDNDGDAGDDCDDADHGEGGAEDDDFDDDDDL